ncbi:MULTISPECIES: integrase [Sorangium]|uniref:Integrase-like protein n=1 Tax=Sorangium cellulosum (strain So ce56) TaxID=448385 RepID=A9F6J5_SORC5|nr:integrase [Sorangium cellulosum]CAN91441.1 Integrase-like protein [Sorangium cellulosum So ce56]
MVWVQARAISKPPRWLRERCRRAPGIVSVSPVGDMDRDEAAKRGAEFHDVFDGASLPDNTRRVYSAQWHHFVGWCVTRASLALPARPRLVVAYLAALAEGGRSASTLRGACTAIGKAHELRGFAPPTSRPIVVAWRRRLIEAGDQEPQKAAELTAAQVAQMTAAMGADLVDLRDRALVLVGYAARLRRSELVGLDVSAVVFCDEGIELLVPARRIVIPPGRHQHSCTPGAVRSWIDAAALAPSGPLFVGINRWGQLGGRLSDRAVGLIVQTRASKAGLSIEGISADSLRAGARDERRLL